MAKRIRGAVILALCLGLWGTACSDKGTAPPGPTGPRLVLLLVVDQARYDYLVRFRDHYSGGLAWLLDQGVVFTDAHYDHAVTATAPGHATLVSGLHPARSGIISNGWYDVREKDDVYAVGDPLYGRSPRNLLGTTLPDWLKDQRPGSRVYSGSVKDRSAVLMGGHRADAALWLNRGSGRFVTSRYYGRKPPSWLRGFHKRRIPEEHFGTTWRPLDVAPESLPQMGIARVDEGRFQRQFPYSLGGARLQPDASFFSAFSNTPFADDYLLELAKTAVLAESLGQGDSVDYLGLSLAVLDSVGHEYGPNSPEVLDVVLRLDSALGGFLDFLDDRIGLDQVLIALSADHGIPPLPEYGSPDEVRGKRLDWEDVLCFQKVGLEVGRRFDLEDWILEDFYFDHKALKEAGVAVEEVVAEVARGLEGCPAVEEVWTRQELETATPKSKSPYFELFVHNFHATRSPDLMIQLKEGVVPMAGRGTTHGSAYAYDTHVPLVLVVPGVEGREIGERVYTVDLAPTLASLLGIAPPPGLDGVDRSPLFLASGE